MDALKGRVTVVTGAGRGLGAALAIALADAGCTPVLCGRNMKALAEVAATIVDRTGIEADIVELDLADAASVKSAGDALTAMHPAIDLLINNGAMWLESSLVDYSAEEVLGAVNSSVSGTFLLTQGLLPALKRSSGPDIVTIGSVSGLPNAALQTVSVPFYAAKRAQAALADGFRQVLMGTAVRSIDVHPPNLDDVLPDQPEWERSSNRRKGERATNRDIVDAVLFAITRPRHVSLSIVVDADDGGLFAG